MVVWLDAVAELPVICTPIKLDEEVRELSDVVVIVVTALPPPGM
jgi:hypothetical protein